MTVNKSQQVQPSSQFYFSRKSKLQQSSLCLCLILSLGVISGVLLFLAPVATASIFDFLTDIELTEAHPLYDVLEWTKDHSAKIENSINKSQDFWQEISDTKTNIQGTLSSLDSLKDYPDTVAKAKEIIDNSQGIYKEDQQIYNVLEDAYGALGNIDLAKAKAESEQNLADSFTYNKDTAESEIARSALEHNSEFTLSVEGQTEGLARVETSFNSAVATETISDDSQTAISTQQVLKNLTKQIGFLAAQNSVIAATAVEDRQTLALQSQNLANMESHLIGEREKERSQDVSIAFGTARLISFFSLK